MVWGSKRSDVLVIEWVEVEGGLGPQIELMIPMLGSESISGFYCSFSLMRWSIYPRGTAVCMSPGFPVAVTVDWDSLRLWRQGEVETGFSLVGGGGGLTQ